MNALNDHIIVLLIRFPISTPIRRLEGSQFALDEVVGEIKEPGLDHRLWLFGFILIRRSLGVVVASCRFALLPVATGFRNLRRENSDVPLGVCNGSFNHSLGLSPEDPDEDLQGVRVGNLFVVEGFVPEIP